MNTEILVTGASGNLGTHLLKILDRENMSYQSTTRKKIEINNNNYNKLVFFDIITGEGIEDACRGKQIIFHLASSTKKPYGKGDVWGTKKLVLAAQKNNIEHFIFISIVGIEKVPLNYYRYKLEAEEVIKQSGIPYTILRTTQFHELIDMLMQNFLKYPIGVLPMKAKNQPIETRIVAEELYKISQKKPLNGILNLGGVEVLNFKQMAKKWQQATGKKRIIIPIPIVGKFLSSVKDGDLTCPEKKANQTCTWDEYLLKYKV